MIFNLSVVNFIPDAHLVAINHLAEVYGCGPNNISVKLQDALGNIWWGCHAPWVPEHYAYFNDPLERSMFLSAHCTSEEITACNEAYANLYTRAVLDGDPVENINAALAEKGLSRFE